MVVVIDRCQPIIITLLTLDTLFILNTKWSPYDDVLYAQMFLFGNFQLLSMQCTNDPHSTLPRPSTAGASPYIPSSDSGYKMYSGITTSEP